MESFQIIGGYLQTAVTLLVILTILVAVHELGHYWVARLFGMKVEAFAVMMGGLRAKTDLASRLKRPLAPAWIVVALSVVATLATVFGGLEGWPAVQLAGLAGLSVFLPAWTMTRIAALYALPRFSEFKSLAICWAVAGAFFAYATRGQAFEPIRLLTLMGFGSAVAVLLLYYKPVLGKSEDTPHGAGELTIDGEKVAVPFRPLWATRNKEGTEFSLLVLPLGGFAAIKGMHPKPDGSETKIEGGFYSKSPFARLMVLFAGPFFSVALGVGLLIMLWSAVGQEVPNEQPVLGELIPGKPAAVAGLKEGDRVLSVDGVAVDTWYAMVAQVREKEPKPVLFEIERAGQTQIIAVTPELSQEAVPVVGLDGTFLMENGKEVLRRQAQIGARMGITYERLSVGQATARSFQLPVTMVVGLGQLISNPVAQKDNVGGIGSVASLTDEARQQGWATVVSLAALLSITLGVMNLLPVPPLDGGQMMVAFVEMLRGGRRLSIAVQNTVSTVGFFLVIALVAGLLLLDVNRFLGG